MCNGYKEGQSMGNKFDLLGKAETNQTPVGLYGAGKYGRITLANIRRKYPRMNVQCFVDDNYYLKLLCG